MQTERKTVKAKQKEPSKAPLPGIPVNWPLFITGLLVIIVGYIFLHIPPVNGFYSLTLAPILLVIGYCIVIPLAIFINPDRFSLKKKDRLDTSLPETDQR